MRNITYSNKIGEGQFSKAYLQKDSKTVVLTSKDPVKECMSLGMFPNSRFFPKIERIDYGIYKMKYYPKVNSLVESLKLDHYLIYKQLRTLHIGMCKPHENMYHWIQVFKRIRNNTVRKALIDAIEAIGGYGTYVGFEISPRNVAVDKNGNLILLDCFFMIDYK